MKPVDLIAVLYDLTLAIGGESRVQPLLTRVLQRLLFHTSLPAGVAIRYTFPVSPSLPVIARAIGNRQLTVLEGQPVPVPEEWVTGEVAEFRGDGELVPALPHIDRYGYALRLPVRGFGAIVLLGASSYSSELPLTELFKPILRNLEQALSLCAASEAYTAHVEEERARAQSSLMLSEAELKRVQALSKTGSWVIDVATGRMRASEEAYRIMGYPEAEGWTLQQIAERIHPEDRDLVRANWASLLAGGPFDCEHRLVIGDVTKWVRSLADLERDAKGSPLLARGTFTDITAHKRTELALDRREKIFHAVVDHAPLAITLIDPESLAFLEYNDTASACLGYTREEFGALTLLDIQDYLTPAQVAARVRRVRELGRLEFENTYRSKDGSSINFWVCANRVHVDGREYLATVWFDITERKRAEAGREKSEQSLELAQTIAHLGSWDFDPATRSGHWSKEMFRLFRRDPAEGVPELSEFDDLLHPADRLRGPEMLRRVLETGEPVTFEYRTDPAMGEVRVLEATSYASKDASGRVIGVSGTVLDITERRRAEEALRARDEVFSTIVAQAMDSIALIDRATHEWVEFNEAAHRDLGYSREEFARLTVDDIQADPQCPQFLKGMARLSETGCAQLECRHRRRDGEVRDVFVRARRLTLRDRSCIAAVWTDITDRKKMEHDLRERLKEMTCLRQIQRLLESPPPLDEMAEKLCFHLVQAMQFPDVCVALLELDGQTTCSPSGYPVPELRLRTPILVQGAVRGQLLVYYTQDKPFIIPEEQNLLDGVAHSLGLWLERREAAAAVRRSDAQYRLLAENAADMIWTTDASSSRFTYASPAVERLLGYTPHEMIGKSALDFVPPSELERVLEDMARTSPSVELPPETLEMAQVRKDGSIVHVELTYRWVLDESGNLQAVGVSRDITERRRAEQEIRKLSLAIEQTPNVVVMTGLDGKIDYVNEAFVSSTGYEREEVLGKDPGVLLLGETTRGAFNNMLEALSRGELWRGEISSRRKDGSEIMESAVVLPLRGESGATAGYVAIKEDITSRKLAEDEIRKLSRVVEQSPESIVITNLDAEIEYVNDAFLRKTGYSREEVIGKNPRVLAVRQDTPGNV